MLRRSWWLAVTASLRLLWMPGTGYTPPCTKMRKDAMTTALQQQLLHDYLSYSDTVFAYSEQLSKQIMNYEPKQILLLHPNQFEADHISELIELFRKRGYRFITLEDALSDQAYYFYRRGRHRLARSLGHHIGQASAGSAFC